MYSDYYIECYGRNCKTYKICDDDKIQYLTNLVIDYNKFVVVWYKNIGDMSHKLVTSSAMDVIVRYKKCDDDQIHYLTNLVTDYNKFVVV